MGTSMIIFDSDLKEIGPYMCPVDIEVGTTDSAKNDFEIFSHLPEGAADMARPPHPGHHKTSRGVRLQDCIRRREYDHPKHSFWPSGRLFYGPDSKLRHNDLKLPVQPLLYDPRRPDGHAPGQ